MFVKFIEIVTLIVRLDNICDSRDRYFASDGTVLVFDDQRVIVIVNVNVVRLRLLTLVFDVQVGLVDVQS